jgi:uncharacterized protein YecA (UPF0149 family)
LRFESEEQVPEDLAMTLPLNARQEFLDDPGALAIMMLFVSWSARAEPEQFFLPREFLRATHDRWAPKDTLALLAPLRKHYHPRVAPKPSTGPSRKGPCPCGSGEKYKRCCGMSE